MTDETSTTAEQAEDQPTTRTRTRSRTARAPGAGRDASTEPTTDATDGSADGTGDTGDTAAGEAPPARRTRTRARVGAEGQEAGGQQAAEKAEEAVADATGSAVEPDQPKPGGKRKAAPRSQPAAAEAAEPPAPRVRTSRRRSGGDADTAEPTVEGDAGAEAEPRAGIEAAADSEPRPEVQSRDGDEAVGAATGDGGTDDARAAAGEPAAGEGEAADGAAGLRRRRRRRGRRGRGRGATSEPAAGDAAGEAPEDGAGDAGRARTREEPPETAEEGKASPDEAAGDGTEEGEETAPGDQGKGTTRLQARNRGRGRSSGRGRAKSARRPLGGVSEETRRAIIEGPPRRMLVNVGEDRTQVAVLEERTLVEHYVTRKEDVSYVGNIYLGRVQNVLPGMEAAFVDIGKGRNGVLYAGEVNYDEADLEGELPRIEDHLKPGQTVLVQVTKDPMGTKGARLTQHLSIAGRYCVLAPGDGMLGISRKLTDEERDRLRKVLKAIKPEGFGLIVRTAAEGATQEQLEADVSRLTRLWDQVQRKAKEVKPLDAVYEEPHLVMRVIRDVFGTEFTDLVVDSEDLAEQIRDYLADVSPEMVDKVDVHTGEESIFDAYEVTNQVRRALEKKVWLKSGGYLIIEKTEAMWVIDVNTGKFVGKDNLEETVLKNNLEAADEIARQLRLRDMGGIIVIDFVDMLVPSNRDEVLKRFKRELARDKTKSRVMDISKLGLVQMTRKNVSQGLTETFTTTCEVCEGRGAQILDSAFH